MNDDVIFPLMAIADLWHPWPYARVQLGPFFFNAPTAHDADNLRYSPQHVILTCLPTPSVFPFPSSRNSMLLSPSAHHPSFIAHVLQSLCFPFHIFFNFLLTCNLYRLLFSFAYVFISPCYGLSSGGVLPKGSDLRASTASVRSLHDQTFLWDPFTAHICSFFSDYTGSVHVHVPVNFLSLFFRHRHLSINSLSRDIHVQLVPAPTPRLYLDFLFFPRPEPPCRNLFASDVPVRCCALRHSQIIRKPPCQSTSLSREQGDLMAANLTPHYQAPYFHHWRNCLPPPFRHRSYG
jgi:hypothetical protein